jgi:hypothetical protein
LTREYLPAIKRAFFRLYCVKSLYGKSMATSSSPLSITAARTLQVELAAGGGGGAYVPDLSLPAGNIVNDDFSSGNLSAPGASDFNWGGNNSTSLVTMDEATGDPTVIFSSSGAEIYNVLSGDPRDWTALHGGNCLRFRYEGGTDPGVFSEQSWNLVSRSEKTLWMRYALRVPTNYTHENVPDIYGESYTPTANNKLWATWQDAYSTNGTGSNVRMEFRPDGAGGSVWDVDASNTVGGGTESFPFLTVPDDRGKWMYICVKLVTESTPGASDGSTTVWRKWADGVDTWEQTHSVTGAPYALPTDGTKQGWSAGYLMGADNSGYAEDTEFLLDAFTLSTESLL